MTYAKTSPYADTNVAAGNYLGILDVRPVPKTANDVLYEIEPIFHQRPDLAAHAIYGNNKLPMGINFNIKFDIIFLITFSENNRSVF